MLPEFSSYLRGLGVDARLNHRFYAGGLCFVELEAPAALAESIALFSIVRAVRQMPPTACPATGIPHLRHSFCRRRAAACRRYGPLDQRRHLRRRLAAVASPVGLGITL